MSVTPDDVRKIAQLARMSLAGVEIPGRELARPAESDDLEHVRVTDE